MKKYEVIYRNIYDNKVCDEDHYYAIKAPCGNCGEEFFVIKTDDPINKDILVQMYKKMYGDTYWFRLMLSSDSLCPKCNTINKFIDYATPGSIRVVDKKQDIPERADGSFFVITEESKLDLVDLFFKTSTR